ncbi:unnamed protein product [Symbiodinium necroappetens]|uniref:Uncharacterized protein n=1 Tax=Symbiodinium necroappetens TaxID=1628268 RepID=A0A812U1A9_9DINO|nr:unnamed protein product [Symbiodinium necroappetens]
MSGVTSTLVWRDAIIKENRCRVYDPYNNDKAVNRSELIRIVIQHKATDAVLLQVSAISPQRAVAIPEIAGYQQTSQFAANRESLSGLAITFFTTCFRGRGGWSSRSLGALENRVMRSVVRGPGCRRGCESPRLGRENLPQSEPKPDDALPCESEGEDTFPEVEEQPPVLGAQPSKLQPGPRCNVDSELARAGLKPYAGLTSPQGALAVRGKGKTPCQLLRGSHNSVPRMACDAEDAERLESLQSVLSSLELVLEAWDRQISASRKGLQALQAVKGAVSEASAAEEAAEAEAALLDALAASKAIEVHVATGAGEREAGQSARRSSVTSGHGDPLTVPAHEHPESCPRVFPRVVFRGSFREMRRPAKDAAFDVQGPQFQSPVADSMPSCGAARFNKDVWERARRRGEAMLSESQAGAFACYRETLPKALKAPQGGQAKIRRLQVSTEEKILRCYQEMAAGSGMGRGGFLLSANLDRFIALIQEHVSLMLGLEPNKAWSFAALRSRLDQVCEDDFLRPCPVGGHRTGP